MIKPYKSHYLLGGGGGTPFPLALAAPGFGAMGGGTAPPLFVGVLVPLEDPPFVSPPPEAAALSAFFLASSSANPP